MNSSARSLRSQRKRTTPDAIAISSANEQLRAAAGHGRRTERGRCNAAPSFLSRHDSFRDIDAERLLCLFLSESQLRVVLAARDKFLRVVATVLDQ